MAKQHFERGSGCYACRSCGRQTRRVGDGASVGMCDACYELAGFENMLQDGYEVTVEQVMQYLREVHSKGGNITPAFDVTLMPEPNRTQLTTEIAAMTNVNTNTTEQTKAVDAILARKAAKAAKAKAKREAAKAKAPAKAAPKATATSNRGAVKKAVFDAADAAYKALDAKADHKAVLAMRVGVMNDLAAKGFKRTTVSCMLGEWQKTLPKHQQLPARTK